MPDSMLFANKESKESKESKDDLSVNIYRLTDRISFDLNQVFSFSFSVGISRNGAGSFYYRGVIKLIIVMRNNDERIYDIGEVGGACSDGGSAKKEGTKIMKNMHKKLIKAWSNEIS